MKALYNFLTGKGQLAALILAVVCIASILFSIFGGLSSAGYEVGTDLVPILKDKESTQAFDFFNLAVSIPQLLIYLALICLVVFGIVNLFKDPKGAMKFLIAFGLLAVIFFALYAMSDSETTGKISALLQKNDISENVSRMISGGLKTTILLAGLSAVLMVVMEIYNFIK